MIVLVEDYDHLEKLRSSAEKHAWAQMVGAAKDVADQHGVELVPEDLDEACLFLGVQAQVLPERIL